MTRALLLCLVLTSACGAPGMSLEQVAVQTAVTTANTTRLSIETAEATALALYRAEQVAAVERVRSSAGTAEQAIEAVKAVRAKWVPVWGVLARAHEAHAALVALLKAYQTTGEAEGVPAKVAALVALLDEVAEAVRRVRGKP